MITIHWTVWIIDFSDTRRVHRVSKTKIENSSTAKSSKRAQDDGNFLFCSTGSIFVQLLSIQTNQAKRAALKCPRVCCTMIHPPTVIFALRNQLRFCPTGIPFWFENAPSIYDIYRMKLRHFCVNVSVMKILFPWKRERERVGENSPSICGEC